MSLYNFSIQKDGVDVNCSVLAIVPNTDYCALFLNNQSQTVKSNFPFFLFIQTDSDKYFLPGLSFIIANPQLGLERYVGYALASKCNAIPDQENYALNPFMPSPITDPIKSILDS